MMTLPATKHLSKDTRDLAESLMEIMALVRVKSQESRKNLAVYKKVMRQEMTKLQDVSDSLSSGLDDPQTAEEITRQKQTLCVLNQQIDETTKEISHLQLQVKEAESELEVIREQHKNMENKLLPRARYAVNLFRQVSHVSWQQGQSSHEVKGFIRGKSSLKAFCFDEQKQSNFFITNSLWEMGEEELW